MCLTPPPKRTLGALRSTLGALGNTFEALRSTLEALWSTLRTLRSTLEVFRSTLWALRSTLGALHRTLGALHRTLEDSRNTLRACMGNFGGPPGSLWGTLISQIYLTFYKISQPLKYLPLNLYCTLILYNMSFSLMKLMPLLSKRDWSQP